MTKLIDNFPMALARNEGTVVVLPIGVYFPIDEPGATKRIVCFYTRAGLRKLPRKDEPHDQLRVIFREHRPVIERHARALYDCPASSV